MREMLRVYLELPGEGDAGLGDEVQIPRHVFGIRLGKGVGVTGVPRPEETAPPQDPAVGVCLGPYGGPRGGSRFL